MDISRSVPVVTGANRGLGRSIVDALLDRGVPKIYALARDTRTVRSDDRVIPVTFDLLDDESIFEAAGSASDANLLINNASPDPNSQGMSQLWSSDPKSFERAFAEMAAA